MNPTSNNDELYNEAGIQPAAPSIPEMPASKTGGIFPANVDDATVRDTVSCIQILEQMADDDHDGEASEALAKLDRASKAAHQLYTQMRGDTMLLVRYGTDAVRDLNDLIQRMGEEQEEVHIPELASIIRDLSYDTVSFKDRYNLADKNVEKDVKGEIEAVGTWKAVFRRGKGYLERLGLDHGTLKQKIDRVTSHLRREQETLLANIVSDDMLYAQNEQEVLEMIEVIATMEYILQIARDELRDINTETQRGSEAASTLAGFIQNLETKIAEYRNRMFLGWTNGPQIRDRRNANVALLMKLDNQVELVAPLIEKAVIEWRKIVQAMQSAGVTESIDATANELFKAVAEASADALPKIYEKAHTPTVKAETIDEVSKLVRAQAEGILAALGESQSKQQTAEAAMARARRLMLDTSSIMQDAALDETLRHASRRLSASGSDE